MSKPVGFYPKNDCDAPLIGLKALRNIATYGMVSGWWGVIQMKKRMDRYWWCLSTLFFIALLTTAVSFAADPPCDKYPSAKQARCAEIWKELNKEDGPIIAQFGLDQQQRREEGKINAQQHLSENMIFIKKSTEKRIERLKERMASE